MLMLTRREGEAITLETSDRPITRSVAKVDGQQIKVGFGAPRSVKILRGN